MIWFVTVSNKKTDIAWVESGLVAISVGAGLKQSKWNQVNWITLFNLLQLVELYRCIFKANGLAAFN